MHSKDYTDFKAAQAKADVLYDQKKYLWGLKTVRDSALDDLKHARGELERAQKAFDNANEDYQKVIYDLLGKIGVRQ